MTLDDFDQKIQDAQALTDPAERKAALYLTAEEIRRRAWSGHAQKRASDLIDRAERACGAIDADWVDGFESLIRSGHAGRG
jgi:hypothetical protein